jgi:hypothetical protein
LAYLADIFNHMTEKSLSFLGPEVTIKDDTEKLQAFSTKLLVWEKTAEADILANFQMLEEVLSQGAETQNYLSILRNLQTPGNTSELFQNLLLS